jgi:hypothetical protein
MLSVLGPKVDIVGQSGLGYSTFQMLQHPGTAVPKRDANAFHLVGKKQ